MQLDFLLCSERSGSNLITRLIGAHSRVCAPATTHLFRLLGENHAGYGDLMHDFAWHAVCTDVADLLDCKLGRWSTAWTAERLMQEVPERTIGGLLRYLHVQEAAAQGKTQVFIKEIETFRYWDHLRESFPAARFVYLVRDPRDMALSWKKSAAIRGGVVRAAQAWHRDQRGFASIVAELQASRRVFSTTYERLLSHPAETLAAIMRFLDCEYEPEQLEFYRSEDAAQLANSARDFSNLGRPLMRSNVHKFRHELSRDEVAYVELLCGEIMGRMGYALEVADRATRERLSQLEARLWPCELYRKPAYAAVSPAEREKRARWAEVAERMRGRLELATVAERIC